MWRNLVILSLLSLLAYGGVRFLYGRLEKRLQSEMTTAGTTAVSVAGETETPVQKSGNRPDFQVIVKRNIFQARLDLEKGEAGKEEKPKELAQTTLKLALVGTVTGNERDARAIIVDEKKKRQDIYQIGDVVQGALIKKVERGQVVLEVNGRDEVLLIKERKGGKGGEGGMSSYTPPVRPPVTTRSGNREDVPVVRPQRRITFRRNQVREILEPAEPLPAEQSPAGNDQNAAAAAEPGPPEAGGDQITGEDEAVQ